MAEKGVGSKTRSAYTDDLDRARNEIEEPKKTWKGYGDINRGGARCPSSKRLCQRPIDRRKRVSLLTPSLMSLISRQDGKPSRKGSSPVCVHCAPNSRKPLEDTVGGGNNIKN